MAEWLHTQPSSHPAIQPFNHSAIQPSSHLNHPAMSPLRKGTIYEIIAWKLILAFSKSLRKSDLQKR